jgi:hypothetical protein
MGDTASADAAFGVEGDAAGADDAATGLPPPPELKDPTNGRRFHYHAGPPTPPELIGRQVVPLPEGWEQLLLAMGTSGKH